MAKSSMGAVGFIWGGVHRITSYLLLYQSHPKIRCLIKNSLEVFWDWGCGIAGGTLEVFEESEAPLYRSFQPPTLAIGLQRIPHRHQESLKGLKGLRGLKIRGTPLNPIPKAQNFQKALYNMVFGPKSLKI